MRPITQADLIRLTEKVRRRVIRWFPDDLPVIDIHSL